MTKKEMKENFGMEIERSFNAIESEIKFSHGKGEKQDEKMACIAGMIYGILNVASLFDLFSTDEINEYHHRIHELENEYHKVQE